MGRKKATHCPAGHEYTEENSYHHPSRGGRVCRKCHRDQNRKTARRRRARIKAARGTRDAEGRWQGEVVERVEQAGAAPAMEPMDAIDAIDTTDGTTTTPTSDEPVTAA